MIAAYHLIWTIYGAWLPNDPRGSGSEKVAADVIAASARMNIWAQEAQNRKYDLGKSGTAHLERWLEIVDFFTKAEDQCIAAVNRFNEGGDHKKLAEALRRLADTFNQRPTLPPNQISN